MNPMKRYLPPHKRNVVSNIKSKTDKFQDNWLSTTSKNQNNDLKTANFPALNETKENVIKDKEVNKEIYNYKSVTDLFKKKREIQNRKKNKLPPGWIILSKNVKYKKSEMDNDNCYTKQIESDMIKKILNRQEEYYRNYEELTGQDIKYYVSESEYEDEDELSDYESESVSEEENTDEYYDEQDIYLKKYNRN